VDTLRRLDRRRQRLHTAMRWLSMHRSRRYGGRAREARLLAWHEERARLLTLRQPLLERIGRLKAAIKERNVLANGRVQRYYTPAVAEAFFALARERLDADTVAAWLAEAQARVREKSC
jgi:hypothetical protein